MAAARVGYRNLAAAKRILFPVASVTSKTYHRCICVGFAANVNEKVTHTGQVCWLRLDLQPFRNGQHIV